MAKPFFGHRNGSPDEADVLTPTRVVEIGGSIPASMVQEFRRIPNALPSVFPPAAVQGLAVGLSTSGTLVVSWSAPSDNGGASVTGYQLTGTDGTSNGAATSPATITGLEDGIPYTFTVAAINSAGVGAASSATNTPANAAPAAPTGVTATAGNASATVTWTAPANTGGSAIQSYTVNCSDGQSQTVSGTTATFGLTNGVAVTFTVSATNTANSGPFSSASNSVTPSGGTLAGAPTGLSGTAGNAQVALSWTAPASAGTAAITDYVVEYTPSGGSASTVTIGSESTSYTKTGLTNDTSYSFRVAAITSVGTGTYSSSTSVTPTAGSTPVITITQQPVAATVTNGTGTWSVTATTTSGTLTYQWQRHQGGGNYANISGATSASYTRTQMTPNDEFNRFYQCVVSCVGATSVTSSAVGFAANPTWYGNFNSPSARWTAVFGATTETSGSNASRYIGSTTGETWDANPSPSIRTSKAGTLRITGAITGDDNIVVTNFLGNALFSAGGGGLDETLNATITGVIAGDLITIEGTYLAFTNLNIWIQ